MRILGYPPGWLEEARLQHSGLALFNSDGNADDGSDEEGEIICPGDKDKYDIKKIIDFPGFNVEPPYGTREVRSFISNII
jgi:zinc finger CCHC domain-containing protein 8